MPLKRCVAGAGFIGIHYYLAIGVQRYDAKHGRVVFFIRDLGALEGGYVQVVHVTDLLRVLDAVHVHVQITGDHHGKVFFACYLIKGTVGDAFIGIFRIGAGLGAMHHQKDRLGVQAIYLLGDPLHAAVIEVTAVIRRSEDQRNLFLLDYVAGVFDMDLVGIPAVGVLQKAGDAGAVLSSLPMMG